MTMPYKEVYVQPRVFLTCKGIKVYHTYEDGNFDEPMKNWFTLDKDDEDHHDEDNSHFDARKLSTFDKSHPEYMNGITEGHPKFESLQKQWAEYHRTYDDRLKTAIREAIKSGELKTK